MCQKFIGSAKDQTATKPKLWKNSLGRTLQTRAQKVQDFNNNKVLGTTITDEE